MSAVDDAFLAGFFTAISLVAFIISGTLWWLA